MVGMVTNSIPTCTAGEVGIVGFSFTPRRKNMVEREREKRRKALAFCNQLSLSFKAFKLFSLFSPMSFLTLLFH